MCEGEFGGGGLIGCFLFLGWRGKRGGGRGKEGGVFRERVGCGVWGV